MMINSKYIGTVTIKIILCDFCDYVISNMSGSRKKFLARLDVTSYMFYLYSYM